MDTLRDGLWSGRRCFIIGGGPSLKGFDWSLLDGELVIGINRAFEFYDPSILFSIDTRFYNWLYKGEYGDAAITKFEASQGVKVWADTGNLHYLDAGENDIHVIPKKGTDGLTSTIKDGVCTGKNSGYAAINLAVVLGCTEIYLLGFDMAGGEDGKQVWFHGGHPSVQPDNVYDDFRGRFDECSILLDKLGVKVYNLFPQSKLECFSKMLIEDVPKIERPIVVCYYTKNTGYEAYVDRMIKSARLFGLSVYVEPMSSLGSWQLNTCYKSTFLRRMLDKFDQPILWLDTDSVVQQYPYYFDDLDADLSVCMIDWDKLPKGRGSRRGKELDSAVMYLRPTDAVKRILDMCVLEVDKILISGSNEFEQRAIGRVIQRSMGSLAHITEMPMSHCQIFDSMCELGQPVIEQLQASRQLKVEVE